MIRKLNDFIAADAILDDEELLHLFNSMINFLRYSKVIYESGSFIISEKLFLHVLISILCLMRIELN